MSYHLRLLLLLSFIVTIVSCAPAAEEAVEEAATTEADVEAINSQRDEFITLNNANDAAGLASLYTNDAMLMPPNQEAVSGKQEIQSWFQTTFDQFTSEITLASEELEVGGDWAFDRGAYLIVLTPKASGEAAEDRGKYITILRKQADGSWKMARDIWNSDNLLPAQ